MTVPTAPSEHISFIINLPFKVAPFRHVKTGLSHCIYDLCVSLPLRCILFLHVSGDFCSSLVSNQTDQEHSVNYSPVFYFRRSVSAKDLRLIVLFVVVVVVSGRISQRDHASTSYFHCYTSDVVQLCKS